MALTDYKITDSNIAQKGVVNAPDKLTGTAAQNKAIFDRLVREIVKSDFNNLIDELSGAGGLSALGISEALSAYGSDADVILTDIAERLEALEDDATLDTEELTADDVDEIWSEVFVQ